MSPGGLNSVGGADDGPDDPAFVVGVWVCFVWLGVVGAELVGPFEVPGELDVLVVDPLHPARVAPSAMEMTERVTVPTRLRAVCMESTLCSDVQGDGSRKVSGRQNLATTRAGPVRTHATQRRIEQALKEREGGVRRKITLVALTAVVVGVTLFGLPLAVAVDHARYSDERGELERIALRGAGTVSPDYRTDPVELPATDSGVSLGVYDPSGTRVTGDGPTRLEPALREAVGHDVVESETGGKLLVAVPVSSGERVIALVRAAGSKSGVRHAIWLDWAAMAGLALAAMACAAVIAGVQARRLATPLATLAETSARLGDGDLVTSAPTTGVAEIDQVGDALNRTTARLSDLIERERALATHASHQLRTPLTALRLELESALAGDPALLPAAVEDAIGSADQLSATIDDVLTAARPDDADGATFEIGDLLDDVQRRWHGILAAEGRRLRVGGERDLRCGVPRAAARQIVDVLVDNALKHGAGTVQVLARSTAGAVALDVIDEGSVDNLVLPPRGVGPVPSGSLGLAIAESTAIAHGARLVVGVGEPMTRVTILVPGDVG
jgi:signal transduction histidine kinase